MLNNHEKELLLKLLMEKATKIDIVNLEIVKPVKTKRAKRFYGQKPWSQTETNFLKESITAGRSYADIAKILERTTKAVETRAWLLRAGKIA